MFVIFYKLKFSLNSCLKQKFTFQGTNFWFYPKTKSKLVIYSEQRIYSIRRFIAFEFRLLFAFGCNELIAFLFHVGMRADVSGSDTQHNGFDSAEASGLTISRRQLQGINMGLQTEYNEFSQELGLSSRSCQPEENCAM